MTKRGIGPKGRKTVGNVLGAFQAGTLRSGSRRGPVVTDPQQAKAIALTKGRQRSRATPRKR